MKDTQKHYVNFFDELKTFKEKQQKQKERGLNDYNLLTTVLNEHNEVRLHSRVIGSLLDINGLHYQKELFLEKFFEMLHVDNFDYDLNNSTLLLEYQNIDLYLTDGVKHIIIENKIYAGDQEKQLQRYIDTIRTENINLADNDILVIYLSIDRSSPSQYSLGELVLEHNSLYLNNEKMAIFKNINYKNEIFTWLNNCLYEIQNITNLNESIQQYKYVVEKITNKYKEKVMPLKNFLLEDDNLKLAIELEDSIKDAKIEIQSLFWQGLYTSLRDVGQEFQFTDDKSKPIDIEHKIKEYYYKNRKYYGLTKELMKINEKYSLLFYIEIDYNIVYGFSIAENGERKNICKQPEFNMILQQILDNQAIKWNGSNQWWLSWKYPNTKLDFYHFDSDVIFDIAHENRRKTIIKNLVDEIALTIKTVNVNIENDPF